MNEQSLQQILTLQQALTTAAAAAVINSLLNPNQASNPLVSALTPQNVQAAAAAAATTTANNQATPDSSPSSDLTSQQLLQLQNVLHLSEQLRPQNQHHQQQQQHHLQHHQQQQQQHHQPNNPAIATSPTHQQAPTTDCNSNQRIQELILQLQQQAALGQSPLALNLNNLSSLANQLAHPHQQQPITPLGPLASPIRSPASGGGGGGALDQRVQSDQLQQQLDNVTNSNTTQSIKKLKRHHQQTTQLQSQSQHNLNQSQQSPYHNRTPNEATSKPQHQHQSTPKSHSAISNLARNTTSSSHTASNNTTGSPSPSSFLTNNVGLPRKLVRGQDVWLGRGAEQTRQILKCMWCGQSFRTLAEMAQHMKVTQHYTNIISQEQITSWRQPESSETNNKQHKSSAQARGLDQNLDDSSDKLNASDGEDSFSDHEEFDQRKDRSSLNRQDMNNRCDSLDNLKNELDLAHIPEVAIKNSHGSKPMTRSRKREREASPDKSEFCRESSPSTSSSSRTRMNNGSTNTPIAINENSETSRDGKTSKMSETAEEDDDEEDIKHVIKGMLDEEESKANLNETNEETPVDLESKDDDPQEHDNGDNSEADVDSSDVENKVDISNENNESIFDTALTSPNMTKTPSLGSKGDAGDPLSALETMVEKSFDPRLRPGVANGGILQRLGIDEEVCPPWQHINYANWYAAAAYGHPMAAALLAAGLNLQNGIKLSKNMSPKKNEE